MINPKLIINSSCCSLKSVPNQKVTCRLPTIFINSLPSHVPPSSAALKDYGFGIRRMRLYYDHIAEVEDDKSDSEDEEEKEAQKSIF